jgi:hypothetical protein
MVPRVRSIHPNESARRAGSGALRLSRSVRMRRAVYSKSEIQRRNVANAGRFNGGCVARLVNLEAVRGVPGKNPARGARLHNHTR